VGGQNPESGRDRQTDRQRDRERDISLVGQRCPAGIIPDPRKHRRQFLHVCPLGGRKTVLAEF
jgi:hypothetical protein